MRIILAAASLAMATMTGGLAYGQDYPTRPIRLVVAYPPGGGVDVTGRIVAEALTARLGQQVVVENRPGAGGLIGAEYVAKSPPDGYTLNLSAIDTLTTAPAMKKDMPYRVEDLTFIAKMSHNGMTIALNPGVPAKNFQEFIEYGRANPGKIRFGYSGIGSAPHLAGELLQHQAGIKMTGVNYKGIAPAMADLVAGHIDMVPLTAVAIAPYAHTDKVRIVGYTAPQRNPGLPDVPTLSELGMPKATVLVWYSIVGPPGIPASVTERLRKEVVALLQDPVVKEKLGKVGSTIAPVVGDDMRKMVLEELQQWRDLAKAANITYPE